MNYTTIDTLSVSLPFEIVTKYLKPIKIKSLYQDARVVSSKIETSFDIRDPSNIVKSEELKEFFSHQFGDAFDFAIVYMWEQFLSEHFGFAADMKPRIFPGKNYFNNSIQFDGGFIAWGGNNKVRDEMGITKILPERVQIFFDGKGCELLTKKILKKMSYFLDCHDGRITRCDVAFDSLEGVFNLDYCLAARDDGLFTTNGRPPKCRKITDLDNEDGNTVYVGRRGNGKMLRCYEKGKQLGDMASPWVRWEVEFTAKDRIIPLDILTNHDSYFSGAYPVLSIILEQSPPVCISTIARQKLLIPVQALRNHCRNGYGKLLRYLRDDLGLSSDQIIDDLARDGVPQRLRGLVHLDRLRLNTIEKSIIPAF
jgi:DNA relaxase NicK